MPNRTHFLSRFLLLLSAVFVLPQAAQAYDVDTHFYATYAMARYAGIRHEVAMKIATTAQWMDESYISDPTNMLLLPVTGVEKRRLLHFPSNRIGGTLAASIENQSLGFGEMTTVQKELAAVMIKLTGFKEDLKGVLKHTKTERNNEFASVLFLQGLREGNLMKCGASLHVIEDSYAHEGFAAEEGHMFAWHWPDRPYYDVTKYFQMTETVFMAMVAIRDQLTAPAKDCSVTLAGGPRPNCEMSAQELYKAYSSNAQVRNTVSLDALRHFDYIRPVLKSFFAIAEKNKYLLHENLPAGMDFDSILEDVLAKEIFFEGKLDSYDVLELYLQHLVEIQTQIGKPLLNMDEILNQLGLTHPEDISMAAFIKERARVSDSDPDPTGMRPFLKTMVRRILANYVPFRVDHMSEELEDDAALPREREMEMRVANMQALIKSLFNIQLVFIENSSKDEIGFYHEVILDPAANQSFSKEAGVEYATFTLKEKNRFDNMIFDYLFPSLKPGDLKPLTEIIAAMRHNTAWSLWDVYAQEREKISHSDMNRVRKMWWRNVTYAKWAGKAAVGVATEVEQVRKLAEQIAKPFIADTINAHLRPYGYLKPEQRIPELIYQEPTSFAAVKAKHRNEFPPFLGPDDAWKFDDVLKGLSL